MHLIPEYEHIMQYTLTGVSEVWHNWFSSTVALTGGTGYFHNVIIYKWGILQYL